MANELWIYDVIGEGFFTEGVTAKRVRDDLAKFKATDRVTLRINSPGGDAFEAMAILTMLHQHKGGIDAQIDGVAASAASLIATAGESVSIADGAMIMIHNAWTVAAGNATELTRAAELLGKMDGKLAGAYARKSGKSEADILTAMAAETWLTSDEAIEFGLADAKVKVAAKAFAIPKEFRYKHAPEPRVASAPERSQSSVAALRRKIDLTRAHTSV